MGIDDQFDVFSLLLTGVDFGYEGQKPLFKNVDFGIDMESRSKSQMFIEIMTTRLIIVENIFTRECCDKLKFIFSVSVCIVGPNGVGKSTLLLLLTGKLNPVSTCYLYKVFIFVKKNAFILKDKFTSRTKNSW